MKSIIPRDEVFFDKFDMIAKLCVDAADILKKIITDRQEIDMLARKVKSLEHEADEVVHTTLEHLHRTFVTPLDRSDLHHLLMELDNIIDLIDAAATRIAQYQVKTIPEEARQLSLVILESTQKIKDMVGLLRHLKQRYKDIMNISVEIDRLENEADQLRRTAMARLFREQGDVFELIKWKEILEHLEGATDRCEDVSDIIEGLVIENT